jgi:hypothetical protein
VNAIVAQSADVNALRQGLPRVLAAKTFTAMKLAGNEVMKGELALVPAQCAAVRPLRSSLAGAVIHRAVRQRRDDRIPCNGVRSEE